MRRTLKIIAAIIAFIWAAYITLEVNLARRYAYEACSQAAKAADVAGHSPGFDHDVIFGC
jgi:hypothetical protein